MRDVYLVCHVVSHGSSGTSAISPLASTAATAHRQGYEFRRPMAAGVLSVHALYKDKLLGLSSDEKRGVDIPLTRWGKENRKEDNTATSSKSSILFFSGHYLSLPLQLRGR